MQFTFHKQEKIDLIKSWAIISVAFAFVMAEVSFNLTWLPRFLLSLATAAITVGIGFIFHELAHKWMANTYDCHAEYKADNTMLVIALVTSLFGVVVAAPGAVHISGRPSLEQRGKTSLVGPAANLLLALIFLGLAFTLPGAWGLAAGFGSVINTWLALFNMLPFGMFDGAKVLAWNKIAYAIVVAIAIALAFVQIPLNIL